MASAAEERALGLIAKAEKKLNGAGMCALVELGADGRPPARAWRAMPWPRARLEATQSAFLCLGMRCAQQEGLRGG